MSFDRKIHLRPGEEIVEIIRRHFSAHFWQFFVGGILLLASAFFMPYLFAQGQWGKILFGFWIAVGALVFIRAYFLYRSNFWILTTERLVEVNRHSWFREAVYSLGFADIRDILINRRGLSAGLFNFGSLTVEIKNQDFVVEIDRAPEPERLQSLIWQKRDEHREGRRAGGKLTIYNNFVKILPELNEGELSAVLELVERELDERE